MKDPTPLVRRSRIAIASLWAALLANVTAVGTGVPYLGYVRSLDAEAVVGELDLVTSEALYGLAGLAQFIALVVAAVAFIKWFHAAYANVSTLTGRATNHSTGWTIWGFFVPILHLFRPQQIMREIWDAMYRLWVEHPAQVAGRRLPTDWVNPWWGLFITSTVISNVAGQLAWRASTAASEVNAVLMYLFADTISVIAAVLAVLLVRAVTDLQAPFLSVGAESAPAATA